VLLKSWEYWQSSEPTPFPESVEPLKEEECLLILLLFILLLIFPYEVGNFEKLEFLPTFLLFFS